VRPHMWKRQEDKPRYRRFEVALRFSGNGVNRDLSKSVNCRRLIDCDAPAEKVWSKHVENLR
jgi:hypothetical protein